MCSCLGGHRYYIGIHHLGIANMTDIMNVINVRFTGAVLDKMDQYKATGFFVSRNHFIRVAVADYMARNPVEQIGIPDKPEALKE